MKKEFLLKVFFLFLTFSSTTIAFAQVPVKGTVVDETGESLIGVSVKIKGDEKKGTATDLDGRFSLSVNKKSDILVFSYVGYGSTEVKVNTAKPMEVVLKEDSKYLDEIVVIGYQSVRRRDLTGSVGKADMEELLKAPVANLDQALSGRIAGVNVSSGEASPGGVMDIVIRGKNSVTQGNAPLIVIDGFPSMDASILSSINASDILSFDVLKDASASAIYGARGANGVIMITTKQGEVGKLQISYNGSGGVQWARKKIDMMDAYEFVKLQDEMRPSEMKESYFKEYNGKTYGLEDYRKIPQYDWQDMILRTAWQQNHNITLTGGTSEARYVASLGYTDQDGIIENSNYNKIQGRISTNIRKGKLRVNATVNYNRAVTNGGIPSSNSWSGMNNLFYSVWGYRPVTQPGVPLNSLLDNIQDESVISTNDYRFNPILSLENEYKKNTKTYFQANAFVEYEFIPDLRFKVSAGYTTKDDKSETFNNSKTRYGYPGSSNGINAKLVQDETRSWLNENTVSYMKILNKVHNINGVVGMTLQSQNRKYNSMGAIRIPSESIGMVGLKYGEPTLNEMTNKTWTMMSYLGRLNYTYDSKYYVTGSFRADGSSKFAKKNRWGYFPSASVAWGITEESFMEDYKHIINVAKVRVGWGMTGNNNIDVYDRYTVMRFSGETQGNLTNLGDYPHSIYPVNNVESIGLAATQLANNDLKWETTSQANVGLDLSFINSRVNLTFDWYNKETRDLLNLTAIPLSTGFNSVMRNVGKVRNRGFEISLSTINIETKDFKWTTDFNISFNKNKVLSLAEDQASLIANAAIDQNLNGMSNYIAKVGQPIGMMYGYLYEGTYKLDEFDQVGAKYVLKPGTPYYSAEGNTQPGFPKYADINGDGIIDSNDQVIIGRGDPKHTGGFTNNFEYKGFDLGVFFQWSYGNDVLNANKLMFESGYNNKKDLNQFASFSNRWTFENPTSNIPRVSTSSSNLLYSSRLIEDGSYLRLKTITLGYTLPNKILKKLFVKKARFYVSAQNLITFTNYSGYDPEVSVRNSALTPGVDFSAYPRAATFSFGVNLNF